MCILVDGLYMIFDIDDCNSLRLEDIGSIFLDDCLLYKDVINRFLENIVLDGSRVNEIDSGFCVIRFLIFIILRLW